MNRSVLAVSARIHCTPELKTAEVMAAWRQVWGSEGLVPISGRHVYHPLVQKQGLSSDLHLADCPWVSQAKNQATFYLVSKDLSVGIEKQKKLVKVPSMNE